MKLTLQRFVGDCGVAALASLLEQPYEDVFVEAAKVDKKCRGRNGIYIVEIQRMAKALGVTLRQKTPFSLDDDEGLLIVRWLKGSRHEAGVQHLVAVGHGVIVDPADGTILPPDDYLAREKAHAMTFLELQ